MRLRVVHFPVFPSLTGADLCEHRFVRFFIEPIWFVTELDGVDQAGLSPVIDLPYRAGQHRGRFLDRKPAPLTQPLPPPFELILAPELIDDP